VEIKCQLDVTEVFIADLNACSTCFGHHYAHHQELKSIIQWLLPVVSGAVVFKLLVVCSQIHTKHINTVCGQNVELLNVKLVVQCV
jgi:hypothetical protein